MNTLRSIYPLMIEKYETFIPNIEGMDIIQKTNSIIQYLNRIGKLNNDVVSDWNKVMVWVMGEGLTDAVNSKVDVLIENGLFDELYGINNYTITPTYTNGQLTKVDEKDGSVVKTSSAITYNSDGTVNTVTELIDGKTVVSTLIYVNGEFSFISKVAL
jgi:hypothetical protein